MTHADISLSQQVLNFSPRTRIKEGLHLFVEWFKDYEYNQSSPLEEQETSRRKADEILRYITMSATLAPPHVMYLLCVKNTSDRQGFKGDSSVQVVTFWDWTLCLLVTSPPPLPPFF